MAFPLFLNVLSESSGRVHEHSCLELALERKSVCCSNFRGRSLWLLADRTSACSHIKYHLINFSANICGSLMPNVGTHLAGSSLQQSRGRGRGRDGFASARGLRHLLHLVSCPDGARRHRRWASGSGPHSPRELGATAAWAYHIRALPTPRMLMLAFIQ